jgi:hypothetical protein
VNSYYSIYFKTYLGFARIKKKVLIYFSNLFRIPKVTFAAGLPGVLPQAQDARGAGGPHDGEGEQLHKLSFFLSVLYL